VIAARLGSTRMLSATRGEVRRQATLIAIGVLLVLGTSPVYVHHLLSLTGAEILAGIDHLGALCVTALHLLLLPVHRFFQLVILAGVAYAVWDRVRAWRSLRCTLALLDQRAPSVGDRFWRAAIATGVSPARLRVVSGLPNPAFTVGLLAPRIYLAQELADRLTPDQLSAVVAHEGAHVTRRDPLRIFLLRLLACTLFWIPALRRLEEDVRDEAEVLADDVAARGRPLVLASAILALADWGRARIAPELTIGFHRDELLERRIRRLTGEEAPRQSHVTRRSIVGAVFVLSLCWSSGVVMAHPMPNAAHRTGVAAHCQHHGGSALDHLFCLGSPFARALHRDCPHRVS
jgi:Zn-dependent protease with chaperone function